MSQPLNKNEVDVSLEEKDAEDEGPIASHSEAFHALEKALCWYEIQKECVYKVPCSKATTRHGCPQKTIFSYSNKNN